MVTIWRQAITWTGADQVYVLKYVVKYDESPGHFPMW